MKYTTATVLALVGVGNAFPHPQLGSFPAFSMPSFSLPTGGFGSGSGSGNGLGNLPAATGVPSLGTGSGSSWSDFFGGGGFGTGTKSTAVQIPTATATQTSGDAAPTSTGNTGGSGTIGASCTPQGAGGRGSEDGIKNKNCCTDMTVVFARGTGETGNVGTISGPPMFKAIREKLGADRVTVQGVDYPASSAVCTKSI